MWTNISLYTRKRNTSNQSFPLNTNSSSSALNVCHEVNVNNGVSRSQRTRKKSEKQLQYEEYKNNEEHISHIQKSARSSYRKQKSDKQKERRNVERVNRSTNLHSNRRFRHPIQLVLCHILKFQKISL